ncbi:arsenate reductase (glutaredoxin) [Endozoicomonas acroporae]|uniref:arsenate reductase (glutaredoxin) n=1 Tax=Endozoicomonas TaxID=305899 RepID=UPI000C77195B|nr:MULTISPECIES: arsenate reductase (glutaredoxin) [Endozoicomonas]WBA80175.1 arsenate reductase (glutaredoxin) [Endozoicomonas sp. GU-1]WBA87751.1 arsenate reductase (glutaredoxin) [Endozoicomonas sp. GU-1]
MSITIFHNPRCSKSRQTLSILEEQGISPEVVLYLESPPDADQLRAILGKLGINARDLLRKGEQEFKDNNLKDPSLTEEQLINVMCEFPRLIERPIVVNGEKARIGRPPESVLEIL